MDYDKDSDSAIVFDYGCSDVGSGLDRAFDHGFLDSDFARDSGSVLDYKQDQDFGSCD